MSQRQKGSHGPGGAARLFVVLAREQAGVYRNERSGENAFAEQILQGIGDAEGGA